MKKLTVRLDDGMWEKLTATAGSRGINRLVVGLIEGWLAGGGHVAVVSGERAPIVAAEIRTITLEPVEG